MRASLPLFAIALLLAPVPAGATFHLWQIVEVYSNADGSVQYIELFTNAPGQNLLTSHTLASNANTFTFQKDLPSSLTANQFFLVATPGFASKCAAAPPDYTLPAANFFSLVADTLNFAGVDTLTYTSGQLPTDGYHALHEDFGDAAAPVSQANSPTNFAGQVCLPEPSAWLMQLVGLAGVLSLDRWRRRRVVHSQDRPPALP
jgi:hypothetical protein